MPNSGTAGTLRRQIFRAPAGKVGPLLLLLTSVAHSAPVQADCPGYDAEGARRVVRSADGPVGALSGSFATIDQSAVPEVYCAAVAYEPAPGVRGRVRRAETSGQSSQSLSLTTNGLIDPSLSLALAGQQRRDASGARELRISQHARVAKAEQRIDWVHGKEADRVTVGLAGTAAEAAERTVRVRGQIDMLRARGTVGVAVASVATHVTLGMPYARVTAGRTGGPDIGGAETWTVGVENPARRTGLQLHRTRALVGRNADGTRTFSANVDTVVLGRSLHVDYRSIRYGEWAVGVEMTLADVRAGELRLDVGLTRSPAGTDPELLLSGQFSW